MITAKDAREIVSDSKGIKERLDHIEIAIIEASESGLTEMDMVYSSESPGIERIINVLKSKLVYNGFEVEPKCISPTEYKLHISWSFE